MKIKERIRNFFAVCLFKLSLKLAKGSKGTKLRKCSEYVLDNKETDITRYIDYMSDAEVIDEIKNRNDFVLGIYGRKVNPERITDGMNYTFFYKYKPEDFMFVHNTLVLQNLKLNNLPPYDNNSSSGGNFNI